MTYKNKLKLTPNQKAINDRDVILALQEASAAGEVSGEDLIAKLPEMTSQQINQSLKRAQRSGLIIDGRTMTDEQRHINACIKDAILLLGNKAKIAEANNLSVGNPDHAIRVEAAHLWVLSNEGARKKLEEVGEEVVENGAE